MQPWRCMQLPGGQQLRLAELQTAQHKTSTWEAVVVQHLSPTAVASAVHASHIIGASWRASRRMVARPPPVAHLVVAYTMTRPSVALDAI